MPGQRITDKQRRKFFFLIFDAEGPKLPVTRAAKEVGISVATAYRLRDGMKPAQTEKRPDRELQNELPKPKTADQLGTDARASLADINLFGEMFFARRPSPWRYEAAMRAGELLATEDREFIDVNVFPGIGKTTFWTHDLPAWLIAGGYTEDPAFGRALRIMLGSRVLKVSKGFVLRLRRSLDLRRPFWDKEQKVGAEFVMSLEFGRFKPDTSIGEESIWAQDQFLVAQLGELDLYEKEPTVQAAAQDSGFLGERVNLAVWDDIAVTANSTNPEVAANTANWFEDEAETRVEPGGLLALVGQRLTPLDLHRKRLDARVENERGEEVPLYHHIVFPAHHDDLCDGDHRQWDPEANTGCLTDAWRLSERDWMKVRSKTNYRTVYQQEDADPSRILVQRIWLEGGRDPATGLEAPGCYDRDRSFHQWPTDVGPLIDYVSLDPSAGNWWAAEWWAVQPDTRHNYLIEGRRKKIAAGTLLDWDNAHQVFTGWMHEMTVRSLELGHPIRVWVIEAVAAHKYLFQFEHFRRWQQAFPGVSVISHETQRNKIDPELGVEGLLPTRYRTGMKHLPKAEGLEALNFNRVFEKELTTYPFAETDDTVMADWIGEWNLDRIINLGRRRVGEEPQVTDQTLPPYLRKQLQETRTP
jgi:hypothetical protein